MAHFMQLSNWTNDESKRVPFLKDADWLFFERVLAFSKLLRQSYLKDTGTLHHEIEVDVVCNGIADERTK